MPQTILLTRAMRRIALFHLTPWGQRVLISGHRTLGEAIRAARLLAACGGSPRLQP